MNTAKRLPSAVSALSALSAHVRIFPAPANVYESRAILHELKKHGPITSYRSLRYDLLRPAPSSVLLIFANAASRTRLIESTPTSITLSIPRVNFLDLNPVLASTYDDVVEEQKETKTFEITSEPSYFNHEKFVRRQPYHGPFSIDMASTAAIDLKADVPEIGMLDVVKTNETPSRIAGRSVPQTLEEMCEAGNQTSLLTHRPQQESEKDQKALKRNAWKSQKRESKDDSMWEMWSNF